MTSSSLSARIEPHRTRLLVLLALLAGLVIGAALVSLTDDDPVEASATQLSTVQASCRDWMDSSSDASSDDAWCTDMFSYMGGQSHGSMMGSGSNSMMWQSSEGMEAICRDWAGEDRSADSSATRHCSDMVRYMDDHMSGNRHGWMMQDR